MGSWKEKKSKRQIDLNNVLYILTFGVRKEFKPFSLRGEVEIKGAIGKKGIDFECFLSEIWYDIWRPQKI